jgi:hypothetical protein
VFGNGYGLADSVCISQLARRMGKEQRVRCILFSVVFTPSPPTTRQCLGPECHLSMLTITVSPVRACPIHMMGEVS